MKARGYDEYRNLVALLELPCLSENPTYMKDIYWAEHSETDDTFALMRNRHWSDLCSPQAAPRVRDVLQYGLELNYSDLALALPGLLVSAIDFCEQQEVAAFSDYDVVSAKMFIQILLWSIARIYDDSRDLAANIRAHYTRDQIQELIHLCYWLNVCTRQCCGNSYEDDEIDIDLLRQALLGQEGETHLQAEVGE